MYRLLSDRGYAQYQQIKLANPSSNLRIDPSSYSMSNFRAPAGGAPALDRQLKTKPVGAANSRITSSLKGSGTKVEKPLSVYKGTSADFDDSFTRKGNAFMAANKNKMTPLGRGESAPSTKVVGVKGTF